MDSVKRWTDNRQVY